LPHAINFRVKFGHVTLNISGERTLAGWDERRASLLFEGPGVLEEGERSSPPPQKVALYVLWGARCREAREKGEIDREREKRLHSPFALHAPIQWAI